MLPCITMNMNTRSTSSSSHRHRMFENVHLGGSRRAGLEGREAHRELKAHGRSGEKP